MTNLRPAGFSGWMGQMGPDENGSRGRFILDSQRYKVLDRKQQFFECTQHDAREYDFDGRIIQPGGGVVQSTQPLMSGEKAGWYVPLRQRRPSTPYRLGRVIVNAFTSLLFGDQRFPELKVETDPKSEDYVQTLSRLTSLPVRMIEARNFGGSTGTSCLSWAYVRGKPHVRSHNAKFVHVQEWEDRDELVPAHAIECYQADQQVWNSSKRQLETVKFWYRRDWMMNADVVYVPKPVVAGREPQWEPDWSRSVQHNDRLCHIVWIQNLPAPGVDGSADYDGLYDNFDTLDLLLSVISRGAALNLDPTLVLKMDPDVLAAASNVRKGSDNAIVPGIDGDAKYLELVGSSIAAGINLFNRERETTLEVAQCVLLDPDKAAAQGSSSVAQKMLYAPMLAKCDVLREQYAAGMRRLLEPMLVVAQRSKETVYILIDPQTMSPVEERREPKLPPKVDKVEPEEPGGDPTIRLTERDPGRGNEVDPQWGPYFQATPQDKQVTAAALFQLAGQKPILSVESANEQIATLLGKNPTEEWRKLQTQNDEDENKANEMFANASGAMGGKVTHTVDTPGGGTMTRQAAPPPPAPAAPATPPPSDSSSESSDQPLPMTPTAASAIITVNEARHSMGLSPMSEPDGHLSLAAYQAKYANPIAQAANAGLGKVGTEPAGAPPAGPPGGVPKPPPKPPAPPGTPGAPLPASGQPVAPPAAHPPGTPPRAPPGAAPPAGGPPKPAAPAFPHPAVPTLPKPPGGGGFPPK